MSAAPATVAFGRAMGAKVLVSLLLAASIAGCVAFDRPDAAKPRTVAYSSDQRPAALGLVLSGGAARGFAHVGVLKVLEEEGLQPDLVVGTSAGAIVGSLYASGLCGPGLEQAVGEMDSSIYSDVAILGSLGFVQGNHLRKFVDRHALRTRIEDFPIHFAAVATDLQTGKSIPFNSGDVGMAVRASSAVPGILSPAEIGGRRYGDGQIASPIPVESARRLGAKVIIAVDVIYPPEEARLTSALDVAFQAFSIAARTIADRELASADVVIKPRIAPTNGQYAFDERAMLIAAGEQAARDALPRIRAAIAREPVRTTLAPAESPQ